MQNSSGPLIEQAQNNSKHIFTKRRISTDRMKKKILKNNISYDRDLDIGQIQSNYYPLNYKSKFINKKKNLRDNQEYPITQSLKNNSDYKKTSNNQKLSETLLNPYYLVNEYKNAIKEKNNLITILKDLVDIPSKHDSDNIQLFYLEMTLIIIDACSIIILQQLIGKNLGRGKKIALFSLRIIRMKQHKYLNIQLYLSNQIRFFQHQI